VVYCTDVAQDVLQVYRMQHDIKHEELQRLQQDALLQRVRIARLVNSSYY